MPEVAEAEERVDIPKSELKEINKMADAFKAARAQIGKPPAEPKPEAIAAVPPAPEKPAAPERPAAPAPAPTPAPEKEKPAAPSEPPKPTVTSEPSTDPALPADVKGKARQSFEALEGLMRKYRGEVETLKPQYESLAAEKAVLIAERDAIKAERDAAKKGTEEYEALKKQHEEADRIIKQFYIENDPQFQAHYGQRIQAAQSEAVEAVGEHGDKLKAALSLPPSALRNQQVAAIAEGLDDFNRAALVSAYTELKRTEKERAEELAKSRENHAKLQEVRSREAQEQAAKNAQKTTELRNGLFQKAAAQIEPELNGHAEADAIKSAVKKVIFNEATADEYIGVLADAARWRRHSQSIKEKDELIGKLQAQIAEVQASNPTVQSAGATERRTPPPLDNSDIGPKFRKLRESGVK